MTIEGQRVDTDRYTIVPRTLTFLMRRQEILLMKIAPHRGAWAGHYNGLGGHIEQGENPVHAATREIHEECGITPEQIRLCGVVIIDTRGRPGIGLCVFVGLSDSEPEHSSPEGMAEWVQLEEIGALPLVQDLPYLIPAALKAYRTGIAFAARYWYDADDRLMIDIET